MHHATTREISFHFRRSSPATPRKPPHLHSFHGTFLYYSTPPPPTMASTPPPHLKDQSRHPQNLPLPHLTDVKSEGRGQSGGGLFLDLCSWRRRRGGMGRGKIEIKRIENSTNRQVTFSKRRAGILKKAREIGVLCDAEVGVVIFSSAGKLSDYCTPKTTLSRILEKYQTNSGKILWDEKHKSLSAEIDRVKKENDNMQIELRHMNGEDLNSLQPKELIAIEEALNNGQTNLRDKMMDHWRMHKRNEKMLEDEHKMLAFRVHQQDVELSGGIRELELGYHHDDRDFAAQMPFTFRVQPSHPNLQQEK